MLPQGSGEHESFQVTPLFTRSLLTVAVNCVLVFSGTMMVSGCTATTMAGTETAAPARAGESATEMAVIATCRSASGGAGAVYVVATPLAVETSEKVPHASASQDAAQVTPWLLASLVIVAVNVAVSPASVMALEGVTLIATWGTTIVAELDFVASATEVAVSVTARSFAGGSLGTVYVTLAPLSEEVGKTFPHGAVGQITVHFTPAPVVSLSRRAENCAVPPICTVAEAGETLTLIAGAGVGLPTSPQLASVKPKITPNELSNDMRRFMAHLSIPPCRLGLLLS